MTAEQLTATPDDGAGVAAVVHGQRAAEPPDAPSNTTALTGTARDGAALDGTARDGSAPNGSARDGSAPNGSARDGSAPDLAAPDGAAPGDGPLDAPADSGRFTVRLANFTGPFDLLLQLIGKHKLDVTEVALHRVTDEFIAYIRAMGDNWDLDEASEFLLVAATLLDLKAARLLPAAQVEDEEDLALLEARDLLFARLLQYKAFKEAAAHISALETVGSRRYPRAVSLEPRYADALPDLVLGIGPARLLKLAVKAMTPKPTPVVSIDHIHQVRVSVREHATLLRDRLRRAGVATFSLLCADCESTLEVVARFLALLELYREGLIAFDQAQALEELTVRWTGGNDAGADLRIDEYAGQPATDAAQSALPGEPAPPAPAPRGDEPPPDPAPAGLPAGEQDAGLPAEQQDAGLPAEQDEQERPR